jgi:hypothetical protein
MSLPASEETAGERCRRLFARASRVKVLDLGNLKGAEQEPTDPGFLPICISKQIQHWCQTEDVDEVKGSAGPFQLMMMSPSHVFADAGTSKDREDM